MDEVFGEENFVSLIAIKKVTGVDSRLVTGQCDYILFYARDATRTKYRKVYLRKQEVDSTVERYDRVIGDDGVSRAATASEKANPSSVPPSLRLYQRDTILSSEYRPDSTAEFFMNGTRFFPGMANHWKATLSGMKRAGQATRLEATGNNKLRYVRRLDDFDIIEQGNLWSDISGSVQSRSDPKIYVVQTSAAAIARCLLMTTDPGDLVLDPTCGSGTTAYVAEQWGRRWITIDTSRVALALARARIMGAKFPFYLLADSPEGQRKEAEITRTPPPETPTHGDIRQGFVYERVPHITLKSIANNAEIDVIWQARQPAVEAARHRLNAALAGHAERFTVTSGGRADDLIDFTSEGEVALPSGETAPSNGFMEWEIPREPGTPWPRAQRKWHLEAWLWREQRPGASLREAQDALHQLNAARKTNWTFDTLPDESVTPWPDGAVAALGQFWEARIARQQEIDASIAARAEFEYLYDKPYEDRKRIRVAGPFTVESLSPHRAAATGANGELIDELDASRGLRSRESEAESYVEAILENLRSAGVHQKDKGDRIAFTSLKPWPGDFIAAEGRYPEGDTERRAAILIGPEYGTVQRADLAAAAREAAESGFDLVIACAFNFDAHASELRHIGRVPVLQARMNPDLHMAGDLKAGGGNLFTIFGEPDIEILREGDSLRVALKGVDIFKPALGEVTSSEAEDIACWFIDTDYNEESFFVRQAYFPAADIPYKAIRTTLRAEIDEDAWESLKATVSRPFPKPKSGRIAVKVINHLGDEVMKVFAA